MIEATVDAIMWIILNWELVLGIFGSIGIIGLIMQGQKKAELMGWSDEKLEARRLYLLAHEVRSWYGQEYEMIDKELNRRRDVRFKQSTKEEWEKYK